MLIAWQGTAPIIHGPANRVILGALNDVTCNCTHELGGGLACAVSLAGPLHVSPRRRRQPHRTPPALLSVSCPGPRAAERTSGLARECRNCTTEAQRALAARRIVLTIRPTQRSSQSPHLLRQRQ